MPQQAPPLHSHISVRRGKPPRAVLHHKPVLDDALGEDVVVSVPIAVTLKFTCWTVEVLSVNFSRTRPQAPQAMDEYSSVIVMILVPVSTAMASGYGETCSGTTSSHGTSSLVTHAPITPRDFSIMDLLLDFGTKATS